MMRRRRGAEQMSIAFLDVVTCGFGAIILLLMISKVGLPVVLEESDVPRHGVIRDLQEQLYRLRGETTVVNRDLDARREQLSTWQERLAILRTRLAALQRQIQSEAEDISENTAEQGELKLAIQDLTEEMQRLLAQRENVRTDIVGGIPVDSEYIIFIVDSSGSMFQFSWDRMTRQLISVLDTYPRVKGMQIMNDMGRYMFPEYRGRWMEDTPARRRTIAARIVNWHPFSNSSPVEGITQAVRTYYSRDKKISLYYFGDDFPAGLTIKRVVDTVDKINLKDADGKPMVRIHAVGFPALFDAPPQLQGGGARYAALMRELTRRNGGAFVGLDSSR